jgi:hypothetical protein
MACQVSAVVVGPGTWGGPPTAAGLLLLNPSLKRTANWWRRGWKYFCRVFGRSSCDQNFRTISPGEGTKHPGKICCICFTYLPRCQNYRVILADPVPTGRETFRLIWQVCQLNWILSKLASSRIVRLPIATPSRLYTFTKQWWGGFDCQHAEADLMLGAPPNATSSLLAGTYATGPVSLSQIDLLRVSPSFPVNSSLTAPPMK